MAKVKAKVKPNVKKKPIKAGSQNKGGNGGVLTAKTVAIVRRKRKK